MKYPNVQLAYFIERPNRFIAHCRLMETNEEVITHVKILAEERSFYQVLLWRLVINHRLKRKTDYDLIAVKRFFWINIDSQVPNTLVNEALKMVKLCFLV